MSGEITAFGYSVPPIVVLAVLALVLVLLLTVALYLTVSLSIYRSVQATRREQAREAIEDEFLDRLFRETPDWEAWIEGFDQGERAAAEQLLEAYLWELDGGNADSLRALGDALDIPQREAERLRQGNRFDRLTALTWLTMLERPALYRASPFKPTSTRERALVARLLLTEDDPATEELVTLLLAGNTEPFSVFGLDTLYRATRDDPGVFLELATREYGNWSQQLQIQMLQVCQHLNVGPTEDGLRWLTASLESESAPVRAASAQALGQFGWYEPLRNRVLLNRAIEDPSPRVRGAVYEMLAAWGDDVALDILLFALISETHPGALVTGTNALVTHRAKIGERAAAVSGTSWEWSKEHARYDRIVRDHAPEVVP